MCDVRRKRWNCVDGRRKGKEERILKEGREGDSGFGMGVLCICLDGFSGWSPCIEVFACVTQCIEE